MACRAAELGKEYAAGLRDGLSMTSLVSRLVSNDWGCLWKFFDSRYLKFNVPRRNSWIN